MISQFRFHEPFRNSTSFLFSNLKENRCDLKLNTLSGDVKFKKDVCKHTMN